MKFRSSYAAEQEFRTLRNIRRYGTHTRNGVRRMVRALEALAGIDALAAWLGGRSIGKETSNIG